MQVIFMIILFLPCLIGVQIGKNVYSPKTLMILKGIGLIVLFLSFGFFGKLGLLSILLILCSIFYLVGIAIGEKEY